MTITIYRLMLESAPTHKILKRFAAGDTSVTITHKSDKMHIGVLVTYQEICYTVFNCRPSLY